MLLGPDSMQFPRFGIPVVAGFHRPLVGDGEAPLGGAPTRWAGADDPPDATRAAWWIPIVKMKSDRHVVHVLMVHVLMPLTL